MINSISRSGGIPGSSSGNTSRYSHITGTSSMAFASKQQTICLVLRACGWHSTLSPL
uniref:Uncharacterized protein n=1 Tax=Arundo donax TaxID=35708 RepID=A0A0A9QMC3_ARUDO